MANCNDKQSDLCYVQLLISMINRSKDNVLLVSDSYTIRDITWCNEHTFNPALSQEIRQTIKQTFRWFENCGGLWVTSFLWISESKNF